MRAYLLILAFLFLASAAQAFVQSNGTGGGVWSDTHTWTGGVLPTSVDSVTIQGADTVTVDITTATASTTTINGTLKFSRTVNSTMTIAGGNMTVNSGGTLDMGTAASPINASSATLVLAYGSASKQYSLTINNGGNFSVYGAAKTPAVVSNSTITSSAGNPFTAATTPVGWAVGDLIAIGQTEPYNFVNQTETMTVTVVSGNQITFGGAIQYNHFSSSGLYVANLTRNAVVRSSGTNSSVNTAFIDNQVQNTTSFALVNGEFAYIGNSNGTTGLNFDGVFSQPNTMGSISSCTVHDGYYGINTSGSGTTTGITIQNNVFWNAASISLNISNLANAVISGNYVFGGSTGINIDGGGPLTNILVSSNVVIGAGIFGFNYSSNTIVGNVVVANASPGISMNNGAGGNLIVGNDSHGNQGNGYNFASDGSGDTLINNRSYLNNQASPPNYDLYCSNANLTVVGDQLGYDPAGNARNTATNEVFIDHTAANNCKLTFKSVKINPTPGIDSGGLLANRSIVSYNQVGDAAGTVRVYGDYKVSGSTFTIDYSTQLYASAATVPKLMVGTGHSATVNSTNDTNAVSQLITLTYNGTDWTVTGSSSGAMGHIAAGSSQNIPASGNVQAAITITQGGSPQVGDFLDFALIAASNDQNVQKNLQFGPAASGFNNARSRIQIAAGGGFHAVGVSTAPTLVNMLSSGGTYYTFVDSAAFTIQYATFTNMDENGLQFWNSGPFSINNAVFDYSGSGVISTSTFISINSVANSTITLNNVYYGNSRLNVYKNYNYMLSGTNTGLLWTNQYFSGPLILHSNEYNDPSNQIQWGYHLLAPGMWHIMD